MLESYSGKTNTLVSEALEKQRLIQSIFKEKEVTEEKETHAIERNVEVHYSKSVYMNKFYSLRVIIASGKITLTTLLPVELIFYLQFLIQAITILV